MMNARHQKLTEGENTIYRLSSQLTKCISIDEKPKVSGFDS